MRKAAAVIALVLTTMAVGSKPLVSAEPVVPVPYAAFHWNVSGHKMNKNSTGNGMVKAAVDAVNNPRYGVNPPAPAPRTNTVDLVSFNELCFDQFVELRKQLEGWASGTTAPYARFIPGVPANTIDHDGVTPVCGSGEFGMALFSKHGLGELEQYQLPPDDNTYLDARGLVREAQHSLACAPLADRPGMKFCTTHITGTSTTAKPYGLHQIQAVQKRLEKLAADGDTYLVAGDFNAQPSYGRLNSMYADSVNTPANHDNTGMHRELDDTDTRCPGYGEATAAGNLDPTKYKRSCGKNLPPSEGGELPKIDMIFVRKDQLTLSTVYTADTLTIPTSCGGACSDHNALIGKVTLNVHTTD
ncbi:endonuclease/exonuclease/phosphatase family protein [Streptomyces sp. ISL-66]|uniref:endonuclease/exonuclease/phosphatase family protein n=1 Tax=Streptomyces sp. ISL-66 TaxID=2819186 RepID=UPI001BEC1863|nr:endonuclease/exonuclease/phosphatase family protein [Streptomyces sp. ISL-66]MBT2467091.1 endonuclease/exonuclease/phosphatase family protein [Streptomyces sp. ISL-66]